MPIMNGTDSIILIRAYEKENNIKKSLIISITGNVQNNTHDRLKKYDINGIIIKPIRKKNRRNIINKSKKIK